MSIGAPANASPRSTLDLGNLPPGWTWPPNAAMQADGQTCLHALRETGVSFQSAAPEGMVATPVVVPDGNFSGLLVRPFTKERSQVMDCHMALSLTRIAPVLQQAGISALIVSRYYHGRRARLLGRSVRMLSRHALGLAVDVRGLVDQRGRTHWVRTAHRDRVLRKAAAALETSGQLRAVLTPYNDIRHGDHFHLSALMAVGNEFPDAPITAQALRAMARRELRHARTTGRQLRR